VVELLKGTPLVLTTSDQNPTIPGAILINVPNAGAVTDEWQGGLRVLMDRVRNGDKNRPIITFDWSMNRWHARNLAMRFVQLAPPQAAGRRAAVSFPKCVDSPDPTLAIVSAG
jgi:hypothetical protein